MPDINNNSNDSFERFFQQKVNDYDIMYNEADWQDLEGKLDALDRHRAVIKRRFLAGAAIILLFSLLGYFTYSNYLKINQLERQLSNRPIQTVPFDKQDAKNKSQQRSDRKSEGAIVEADDQNMQSSAPPLQTKTTNNSKESETKFLVTKSEVNNLFISDISAPAIPLGSSVTHLTPHLSTVDTLNNEQRQPLLASNRRKSSSPPAIRNDEIRDTFPQLSVGFSMAPDFSTAGSFSDFYNPGYKIGAYAEYNFSRNFSISAGAIYSTVNYTASGSEYRAPSGYWTNGINPAETLAQCVLIDIPITLKYNVLHFGRSRVYATAGISSYIMLSEEYQFQYYGNGMGFVQNWSGKTGTRHWASNAGFSVGFEYDINPILSIRAEPFIRIPLKEVGWGNVRLYSAGTFISLNYKIW